MILYRRLKSAVPVCGNLGPLTFESLLVMGSPGVIRLIDISVYAIPLEFN